MNLLVLDFETFFSKDYTLKRMTTEAYVRDPQFEALLCGFYEPRTGRKGWVPRERLQDALASVDWKDTACLAHHAHFDGLILSHHYGIRPKMWLDTLSMARLMRGNASAGGSLAALAKAFGLPEKTVPYDLFRGRRWVNMPMELRKQLGEACIQDCVLTFEIFKHLGILFPRDEYPVVDATVRMFTEPALVGDANEFERLKLEAWTSKNDRLMALGVSAADLQSAARFVGLLEAEGVEVEYKEGKNGKIPAIAATDQWMRDLVEDEDSRISDLASARLEVRSTIDETRAGRLAGMAARGPMPIYLNYCGAQTLRWSGGDKVNFQNMRRGSPLRKALSAPPGSLLAIIDLSQIEARLLAYLAGQDDLVETFRRGEDPYVDIASEYYGYPITKENKPERGFGKLLRLSCGYGSGGSTICRTAAKGTYGPPLVLTEAEGMKARDTYRQRNPAIVAYWREADAMLGHMARGDLAPFPWSRLIVGPGYLEMPLSSLGNEPGARMLYELKWDAFGEGDRSWFRRTRSGWRRIWGGVLAQNICEAFGRLLISEAMTRIAKLGFKTVLCTHDEIVVLVEDGHADFDLTILEAEVTQVPSYLPGMPIACEGHLSKTYDK